MAWPPPTKRDFPVTEAPSFLRCDLRMDAANPEQCCAPRTQSPRGSTHSYSNAPSGLLAWGASRKRSPLRPAWAMAQNVLNNDFVYAGGPRGGCMAVRRAPAGQPCRASRTPSVRHAHAMAAGSVHAPVSPTQTRGSVDLAHGAAWPGGIRGGMDSHGKQVGTPQRPRVHKGTGGARPATHAETQHTVPPRRSGTTRPHARPPSGHGCPSATP